MKIGMMNNPGFPVDSEIAFAAQSGFDFIDLTLEPPEANLSISDVPRMKQILSDNGLSVIGHTAYYLPIDSPFKRLRDAVRDELMDQLAIFSAIGASTVSIHFNHSYPHRFFKTETKSALWQEALLPLSELCGQLNVKLLLENTVNWSDQLRLLNRLLKSIPNLGFHYDAGHANLLPQIFPPFLLLHKFKHHLHHVHFSDNNGGSDDLHLPIGAGRIPWKRLIRELKRIHYNEGITLEVFSPDREYLLISRKKLRTLWDETAQELSGGCNDDTN